MYCMFIIACDAACATCTNSATNCLSCVTSAASGETPYLYEDPSGDNICISMYYVMRVEGV